MQPELAVGLVALELLGDVLGVLGAKHREQELEDLVLLAVGPDQARVEHDALEPIVDRHRDVVAIDDVAAAGLERVGAQLLAVALGRVLGVVIDGDAPGPIAHAEQAGDDQPADDRRATPDRAESLAISGRCGRWGRSASGGSR